MKDTRRPIHEAMLWKVTNLVTIAQGVLQDTLLPTPRQMVEKCLPGKTASSYKLKSFLPPCLPDRLVAV